jgi:hypothetical protein
LQLFNDFRSLPEAPDFASVPKTLLELSYDDSVADKNVEKTFIGLAKAAYDAQVEPSMHCARRCGNMYTASLYGGLASLVSAVAPSSLNGKRISMFAYGGGSAGSFYTLHVKGDTTEMREKLDLLPRLARMKVVPCQEFVDALSVRSVSRLSAAIYADAVCSSGKRTTARVRTRPRARSTTSGQARGIWTAWTRDTAASTPACRLCEVLVGVGQSCCDPVHCNTYTASTTRRPPGLACARYGRLWRAQSCRHLCFSSAVLLLPNHRSRRDAGFGLEIRPIDIK